MNLLVLNLPPEFVKAKYIFRAKGILPNETVIIHRQPRKIFRGHTFVFLTRTEDLYVNFRIGNYTEFLEDMPATHLHNMHVELTTCNPAVVMQLMVKNIDIVPRSVKVRLLGKTIR
jgi:hypothetical protein